MRCEKRSTPMPSAVKPSAVRIQARNVRSEARLSRATEPVFGSRGARRRGRGMFVGGDCGGLKGQWRADEMGVLELNEYVHKGLR